MANVYSTPGVYIEEKSAFPNSAVPVATAVPAFIGYTQKAIKDKRDIKNQPIRISSFGEYDLYFGEGPATKYDFTNADPKVELYDLTVKGSRFYLYDCIKHFFANGGSDCYIVSVGGYTNADGTPTTISKDDFGLANDQTKGIGALLKEPEPTMLVIPDLVSMPDSQSCSDVQVDMLKHCGEKMRNRFAILDVYNGFKDLKTTEGEDKNVVESFRNKILMNNLQWGAVYYPWVQSSITSASAVDFTNIHPDSIATLVTFLKAEVADTNLRKAEIDESIDFLTTLGAAAPASPPAPVSPASPPVPAPPDKKTLHQTLLAISPRYKAVMASVREKLNLLPPSAAMAGIYSMVDNNIGVFKSPANVGMGSVVKPAVNITNDEQDDLNIPLNGKAVNAIRTFPGKGILVWGARTLDGNSQDWRYISVRRTVIFIEQSIKYAAEPYVFAPNTATTWTNMKAMLINFLTNVWQQGALAGATPEDAFSVDIGLGTTMTPVDILDGYMRIVVRIAVTRPAEFIVITFEQKMQQS